MAYEIITDRGYSPGNLVLLSIANLIITIYLLFDVLTFASLIVISIITFIMFVIQIFTSFRVKRTLANSLMLLLISGGFVTAWQSYMYYQDQNHPIKSNIAAILLWFMSSLFLGRYAYGVYKIDKKTEKNK